MKKAILIIMVFCFAMSTGSSARKMFFEVPKQPAAESKPEVIMAAPVVETDITRTISLKYADPAEISATLSGILREGEYCSPNKQLNLVVLRASAAGMDNLQNLISDLDRPLYDVMLNAKIEVMNLTPEQYSNYSLEMGKRLGVASVDAAAQIVIAGPTDALLSKVNTGSLSDKNIRAAARHVTAIKVTESDNAFINILPISNMDGSVTIRVISGPGENGQKEITLRDGQSLLVTSVLPEKIEKGGASWGIFSLFGAGASDKEILKAYVVILTPNIIVPN